MVDTVKADAQRPISLIEETIRLQKEAVVSGRVEVKTLTETFQEKVGAVLQHEAASITRVPIGREVQGIPTIRTEGDLTIVPVVEEILVVEKRLFLKEEIHIRRTRETEHIESHVTLRRQRAVVTRHNAAGEPRPDDTTSNDKD